METKAAAQIVATTDAPASPVKKTLQRAGFRSCRAAVIFRACGALIRVPCRRRYGSSMSNGLSGIVAPPWREHLMRAESLSATIRIAAAALILGLFSAVPAAAQSNPPP